MADFEVLSGEGVRLRVQGLRATLAAMEKAGADAENMRALMHSVGMLVARAAAPPVGQTGQLGASLRAGRGKTKAVARAGNESSVRYAGVIHYGWPDKGIPGRPYLVEALNQQQGAVLNALNEGIANIIRNNNL